MKFVNPKIFFISVSVIFSLSGCVKDLIPQSQESNIPSWYLNAPANNSLYIYGEGEAYSVEDAKNNALNTMAAKLIVSVGSSISTRTNTSTNANGSSYSKDVTKDLKVDVQKIKFTNAVVDKSKKIGNDFYVLMKVNRQELFKNKKIEFDINDNRITKKYKNSLNYSKLEQINILQKLYPSIKKAKSQSIILNAINNDFVYAPFIEKYDSYIDTIAELKNELIIQLTTNNQKRYFADSFVDILNNENYKISKNNNSDAIISLNNKVKYSIARGWNIAKVSTTISVISNDKTISNRIVNTVGRSSTSKESALENASQNFQKKIKLITLDKIIFN